MQDLTVAEEPDVASHIVHSTPDKRRVEKAYLQAGQDGGVRQRGVGGAQRRPSAEG